MPDCLTASFKTPELHIAAAAASAVSAARVLSITHVDHVKTSELQVLLEHTPLTDERPGRGPNIHLL